MQSKRALGVWAAAAVVAAIIAASCQVVTPGATNRLASSDAHRHEVMTSRFCGECHPAIYAEHAQNTHGRAFTDEEVRLATGRFDHGDCIRCHTPRPVFETGIGMNPMRRHHNLEEGNTCMTCHFKQGYDYGAFAGGIECTEAFDDRVGTVEACASCHRNHGTPYQWEVAPTGKAAKRECVTCHMKFETRPVAVGQPPRKVRSHVFPGSRSEEQLRRAYRYDARIDGNEVVVAIENKGAGHNFPTELKQRSVESLVVVRDPDGKEVSRSRMVFRDPYKRPYGLRLPVNTQIPGGQTREHRVPLGIANGIVETELHYKLYFPIEDHHPDLARRLETRRLTFADIEPSDRPVDSAPDVRVTVPEGVSERVASPANLVDFARPPIGTVEVEIPPGDSPDDIRKLVELFQFPVPEGGRRARERLVEIGTPALPALIEAMGSWDNKTWKQAQQVLVQMGPTAEDTVLGALQSDELYVRVHARQIVPQMGFYGKRDALVAALVDGLTTDHPLDRAGAAHALGAIYARDAAADMRPLLDDADPDVVREAALALGRLGDLDAAPAMERALARAFFAETKRDVAEAVSMIGSTAGIPVLLDGLDHDDDLIRESYFESLFAVTGLHFGYNPLGPRPERLESISALQAYWAANGSADLLRRPPRPEAPTHARAWKMVQNLGNGDERPGQLVDQLVAMGDEAVPALVLGLKYPAGFSTKRSMICQALGRIASREAAPFLASTLRDPVLAVAAWACWALERINDPETLGSVIRYHDRILSMAAAGSIPQSAGSVDALEGQAASTQLRLGDTHAMQDLVSLLLSGDLYARQLAIAALEAHHGERRGYDPEAPADERREAAERWNKQ